MGVVLWVRFFFIKSLHMLQLLEMVEQWPATFLTSFSIVHSVFHQDDTVLHTEEKNVWRILSTQKGNVVGTN